MKRPILTVTSLFCLSMTSWGQSNAIVFANDFEGGGGTFNNGNNGLDFVVVADPTGSGRGNVGQGDVGKVQTQWGAIRPLPNIQNLPAAAEPGVSTFRISMMVYIPSGTTYAVGGDGSDRMGLVVRWNGLQTSANSIYLGYDTFAFDTWTPMELTGVIPALDGSGNSVTYCEPIISFNDRSDDAVAGVAAYIDDYLFEVSVSEDDPNLPLVSDLNFGEVEQNGGPHTKKILLTNSGASQDLTITSLNLEGTDAGLLTLDELTLPLVLAPGEEEELSLVLDPGETLGFLSARLVVESEDASSPTLTTNITATSVEPFNGVEFLVNGDFETGDLTGWRDNERFDATTDQARSGGTSAVFNLAGAAQWGEARIEDFDRTPIDSIPITPDMYGKEYFYSAWYYRPAEGGMAVDDKCQTIFRWNSLNPGNHTRGQFTVGSAPTDTWMRVTGTGIIPETDSEGNPVDHLTILWSFQDVGSDAPGGEVMYIDDVSLKIDVPPVVPDFDPVITELVHDADADTVTLTYEAAANFAYDIERSTGLTPAGEPAGWEVIASDQVSDSTTRTYVDTGAPTASAKFFYRIKESAPAE